MPPAVFLANGKGIAVINSTKCLPVDITERTAWKIADSAEPCKIQPTTAVGRPYGFNSGDLKHARIAKFGELSRNSERKSITHIAWSMLSLNKNSRIPRKCRIKS